MYTVPIRLILEGVQAVCFPIFDISFRNILLKYPPNLHTWTKVARSIWTRLWCKTILPKPMCPWGKERGPIESTSTNRYFKFRHRPILLYRYQSGLYQIWQNSSGTESWVVQFVGSASSKTSKADFFPNSCVSFGIFLWNSTVSWICVNLKNLEELRSSCDDKLVLLSAMAFCNGQNWTFDRMHHKRKYDSLCVFV